MFLLLHKVDYCLQALGIRQDKDCQRFSVINDSLESNVSRYKARNYQLTSAVARTEFIMEIGSFNGVPSRDFSAFLESILRPCQVSNAVSLSLEDIAVRGAAKQA